MKANNSIPSQTLNNAIFTWLHLFVIIVAYSVFYALLRMAGYSEFTGFAISSIFVIAGVVIPNIYLPAQNAISVKFVFITKFVLIPSALCGGGMMAVSPLGRTLIRQLFTPINFSFTSAPTPFLTTPFLTTLLSTLLLLLVAFSLFTGAWMSYQVLRPKTLTHSVVKVHFINGRTKRYFLNLEKQNNIEIKSESWLHFAITTRYTKEEVYMLISSDYEIDSMEVIIPISEKRSLEPVIIHSIGKSNIQFEKISEFNFIIRVGY
jgi:hypothetical protein